MERLQLTGWRFEGEVQRRRGMKEDMCSQVAN